MQEARASGIAEVAPATGGQGSGPCSPVASRGHPAETGGTTPGPTPASSRTVGEKGVLLDNRPLVRDGALREARARNPLTAAPPSHAPENDLAGLRTQTAANGKGIAKPPRAARQSGQDVAEAYVGHLQGDAEVPVRRTRLLEPATAALPPGRRRARHRGRPGAARPRRRRRRAPVAGRFCAVSTVVGART